MPTPTAGGGEPPTSAAPGRATAPTMRAAPSATGVAELAPASVAPEGTGGEAARRRGPNGRPRRLARRTRFWTRLGLRARVTFLFGLGALLLSLVMGGLSYLSARHFLLNERQTASQHQAFVNAEYLRSVLRSTNAQTDPLNSLTTGSGSYSVLFVSGRWYASSLSVGRNQIPAALRDLVQSGSAATQTVSIDGTPEIVVGVPITAEHAAYFEVFDVSDLSHILSVLALILAVTGFVTTVLGIAIGRSASGRTLRPLTAVSKAAVAIAGGDLDTRLPAATGDPDLAGLTTSFNRMVDQLQERIEREARFTSDVSHELRSPLTTLAASLDVLEAHRLELSPRALRALDLLSEDVRRFQRMVDDLLEISRADTGAARLAGEPVLAGELVERSVAAAVRTMPVDATVPEVTVDPRVADAVLLVDKRRFERVVANLMDNAAHYAGGATAVRVVPGPATRSGRRTVRITIDDAGPGISPSERAKVFERFYRGQAAGRRGTGTGTGLGLALVAEHVRLHGGSVWIERSPEGGTRFVLELPVHPVDASEHLR